VNLVTLGTHKDCRTVAGALAYWKAFYADALQAYRTETTMHPDAFRARRSWQRADARCKRALRRLEAIRQHA